MNHQFVERHLWELHKSPRNHISHLLGTPRDHSDTFRQMVEEGRLVRNFRFRGFPEQGMESPRLPATVTPGRERSRDEDPPHAARMRGYTEESERSAGDRMAGGLVYGEHPIDNTARRRGYRNPPHDPPMDTGRSHQGRGEQLEQDFRNYSLEQRLEMYREHGKNQRDSPYRDSRQEQRRKAPDRYQPELSEYQPSFGHVNQRNNGLDPRADGGGSRSPQREVRGIPVLDFLKKEEFEVGRASQGQNGHDLPANRGVTGSPTREVRGIPVTDFMARDNGPEGRMSRGQRSPDLKSSGEVTGSSPSREARGIPVTDFIKRRDLEAVDSRDRSPDSRPVAYRLPEEPTYDPFGKAGGGAPIVDSQGHRRTNVFGNFEKKGESREAEKETLAKSMRREELFRGIKEQRSKRDQEIQYQRAPEVDLADLMRRKEGGRPRVDPSTGILTHHPLSSSDVSKLKMNYQPRDVKVTEEHRQFLQQQMADRERDRQQDRARQQHEASQHFANFEGQWGRGSPREKREFRKLKLDDMLHGYPASQSFYQTKPPYATGFAFGD